jgi:hypothetical protein
MPRPRNTIGYTIMATQASPALLHRFLGIGLLTLGAVFFGLRSGGVELLPPGPFSSTLAYILAGFSLVVAAVALLVLRRRVPARRPGQSEDQYWTRPEVVSAAMLVWFLLEGAGIVAAVGYLLTAAPIAAVVAGLVTAAFWFNGPTSFNRVT